MDQISELVKNMTVPALLMILVWLIKIYYAIKEQTSWMKDEDEIDNIGEI